MNLLVMGITLRSYRIYYLEKTDTNRSSLKNIELEKHVSWNECVHCIVASVYSILSTRHIFSHKICTINLHTRNVFYSGVKPLIFSAIRDKNAKKIFTQLSRTQHDLDKKSRCVTQSTLKPTKKNFVL